MGVGGVQGGYGDGLLIGFKEVLANLNSINTSPVEEAEYEALGEASTYPLQRSEVVEKFLSHLVWECLAEMMDGWMDGCCVTGNIFIISLPSMTLSYCICTVCLLICCDRLIRLLLESRRTEYDCD